MSNLDLDAPCVHPDFDAVVGVGRIQRSDDDPTITAFVAEIQVKCRACEEPFRWNGVKAGLSYVYPMCTPDEVTLRAPLRPASADPDFGMGLPGFAINFLPGPAA